jgi:hypothetical protein
MPLGVFLPFYNQNTCICHLKRPFCHLLFPHARDITGCLVAGRAGPGFGGRRAKDLGGKCGQDLGCLSGQGLVGRRGDGLAVMDERLGMAAGMSDGAGRRRQAMGLDDLTVLDERCCMAGGDSRRGLSCGDDRRGWAVCRRPLRWPSRVQPRTRSRGRMVGWRRQRCEPSVSRERGTQLMRNFSWRIDPLMKLTLMRNFPCGSVIRSHHRPDFLLEKGISEDELLVRFTRVSQWRALMRIAHVESTRGKNVLLVWKYTHFN